MDVQPQQGEERPALPFQFTGDGGEYFKIRSANLCLSILTLGIYSAWAKVRTNRYFWGNTHLGGTSFDYRANPLSILKGRLLVLAFLAAYGGVSVFWPMADAPFGLLFVAFIPWAVVRSLTFRARNSSYRNIRFDFRGRYADAFRVYVLIPLLMPFTLGLIYPYFLHEQKRLLIAHSAYGTSSFRFGANAGDFYRLFANAGLLLIASGILGMALFAVYPPASVIAGIPLYLFLFAYMASGTWNLTYNGATLDRHEFRSHLRAHDLFWIYLTNTLSILLTLGLFIPWARIRVARYRAERLSLIVHDDLDSFVAAQLEEVASTGAEFGEFMDIDVGL